MFWSLSSFMIVILLLEKILSNTNSTRRPGQVPSAEDVAVQMRHGFASVRAVVDHQPVAAFQIQFLRNLGGFEQQMAEQLVVVRRGLGDARHALFRENQNMHRRLRGDVADGEDQIVLINDVRRDFARGDFLEKGFVHNISR